MSVKISQNVFDEPSGNVRGMVVAFLKLNGKEVRIAHATLLVKGPTDYRLSIPTGKLATADLLQIREALEAFQAQVEQVETRFKG